MALVLCSRKRTASELYSQLAPSQLHPPTSELSQELSHDPELRAMNDRMVALRRKLVYHQQRAAEVAEGMRRLQADMDAWTAACVHAATKKARAEQVAGRVLLEQRAAALLTDRSCSRDIAAAGRGGSTWLGSPGAGG